jgi:eukaryotic-like serine/threonine-protein kinase
MNAPTAPRFVDRYALFDVIATGGMASVHLGRLMGPVGFSRTVAIKRLHENFARDPEFVAMFLDEARLVARIRHPNVVQTLDVVASAQELLLVMEYVPGESLTLLIKRARTAGKFIPIPIVVDIVTCLLNGLHAAHEATNERGEPLNVVHRDVSPHNILVGTDGVTRVLDFGIAKAVGLVHNTKAGEVKGKVRYMPPEQIRGQDVNRAADVYAASVVLWEALTTSRLFGAGNDGEVVYKVMEGQIPRPSQLRADIPPELEAIVMRGLHRNPAERFQTARVMAEALEHAAPPVTRSTVSAWMMEHAADEVHRREECVARVESTVTPAPVTSLAPPSMSANGDSTLSRMGSLSQSVTPDAPVGSRWPLRKRLLLATAIALTIAIAALTPSLLRSPARSDAVQAAPAANAVEPPVARAAVNPAPAQPATPEKAAAPAPASSEASAEVPEKSSAAVAAESQPIRKRGSQASSSKRSPSKGGTFDRIYRRD